jgi:hypothetical protein
LARREKYGRRKAQLKRKKAKKKGKKYNWKLKLKGKKRESPRFRENVTKRKEKLIEELN